MAVIRALYMFEQCAVAHGWSLTVTANSNDDVME